MIDRADLIGLLLPALHATTVAAVPLADAILALEKPADGITLTGEEARTAASFIRSARGNSFTGDLQYVRDLVAKLEGAS